LGLYAQTAVEPDFVGEAALLNADSTTVLLEKSAVQLKTAANAGMVLAGIGSYKTKMALKGCCSGVRAKSGNIQVIVRAVDNNTDPLSIIQVIKFDTSKKERKAELSSVNTFGTVSKNNMKMLTFTGKKFGTSSYLLTISDVPPGEYGIIVRNPNSLDEKATIVSCFGVDE
jgi:hypothetical protein